MNYTIMLYALLKEAIQDKDWRDAIHYSNLLKSKNFFDQKSRRGWRMFRCENYNEEEVEYGCGAEFLIATRDCFSPSSDLCPLCNEEVFPSGGFYDDTLAVDEYCNLTNVPSAIILPA